MHYSVQRFVMARTYTLKRRAERQAQTRRRIVEATVELHSTLGPARTTISNVAERAGVQRHTVYAHFPTERDLFYACSGLALERDPLPDEQAWRRIGDPEQRLRRALAEIYGWFARNAELAACVLRDAEVDPLTRDIVQMRIGARMEEFRQVLSQGFPPNRKLRAALRLALSFPTWRSLVEEGGLNRDGAVDLMVSAIRCAVDKR
jgi:AcrR family transcriptional regulator